MAVDISALAAGDGAAFEGLLQLLLSAQNEQRSHAEAVYAELKKQPDACASHLVRSLRTNPDLQGRALCAVLLRKVRRGRGGGGAAVGCRPGAGRPALHRLPVQPAGGGSPLAARRCSQRARRHPQTAI